MSMLSPKVSFRIHLNVNLESITNDDIETFEIEELTENIELKDVLNNIRSKCRSINRKIESEKKCNQCTVKLFSFKDIDIEIDDDDALRDEIDDALYDDYVELCVIIDCVNTHSLSSDDIEGYDDEDQELLQKAIKMSMTPCDDDTKEYNQHLFKPNESDRFYHCHTTSQNKKLMDQLLSMGMGTKEQIMEAMDMVNNRNDIYELIEYMSDLNECKEHISSPWITEHDIDSKYDGYIEIDQYMNDIKEDPISPQIVDEQYPVLPLIIPNNCTYDPSTNTMHINRDKNRNILKIYHPALEFIRNISSKIATISIVGIARTGKSLVAGELYAPKHIPCPFELGHEMDACTYGVWVSAKHIQHPKDADTVILIFDVEGTGFHETTKHNDMQLMVITLLISSYFIYNTKGTFDATALEELEFVTELTDRIRLKPNDEHILPIFMWLLRDVHLEPTINNESVSVKEYFTQKVLKFCKGSSRKNQNRQNIRRVFLETFSKYDAFTLPIPHSNRFILQRLGNIERDSLETEFNEKLQMFYDKVMEETKCKVLYVANDEMETDTFVLCRGQHLAQWIEECIKYVNDPNKIPEIQSMTSNVMLNVFRNSKEKVLNRYKEMLFKSIKDIREPLQKQDIIDIHLNVWNNVMNEHGRCLQGITLQQNNEHKEDGTNLINQQQTRIYNELCDEIGHHYLILNIGSKGILKDVLSKNMEKSIEYNHTFLNNYFNESIKPMMDETEKYDAKQVIAKFKDCYDLYHQICRNSAKDICWNMFDEDKKRKSMQQFKRMKGFSMKLIEAQKQRMAIESRLREETEENRLRQKQIEQQTLEHQQQIERVEETLKEQQKEFEYRQQQQVEKKNNLEKAAWIGKIVVGAAGCAYGIYTNNWSYALGSALSLFR